MRKPPKTAASCISGEVINVFRTGRSNWCCYNFTRRWRANAAQVLFGPGRGKERHRRYRRDAHISLLQHPWDPDTDGNAVACRSTYNFRPGTSEFDQCRGSRKLMPEKKSGLSVERVNQRFTVQPSIGK
jgi:hypothetical protein